MLSSFGMGGSRESGLAPAAGSGTVEEFMMIYASRGTRVTAPVFFICAFPPVSPGSGDLRSAVGEVDAYNGRSSDTDCVNRLLSDTRGDLAIPPDHAS